MKVKLLILVGIFFFVVGCESNVIPSLVGEWKAIAHYPYDVTITDSWIIAESINVSCKYVILSDEQMHIERLWLPKTAVDYMADCQYNIDGDTLMICDFIPEMTQAYPPRYVNVKLVNCKK